MDYVGGELELFAGAIRWKAYLADQISRFVKGRVLEVGAGIGSNIPVFFNPRVESWLAVEPDHRLASAIEQKLARGDLPGNCRVTNSTVADLPSDLTFDAIIYIDVLEHIEHDREEVLCAARRLTPGGRLIVLAPAHQFLFSPFDASIGHFRRYDAASLKALTPASCQVEIVRMLDIAGIILSLGNRMFMRSSMPTRSQIDLWDRFFVPVSRRLDRLTGFRFGKSVLLVWKRTAGP
jgi:SAM-dependent methyltransferase